MDAAEYKAWWAENTAVPYGLCRCGCGQETRLAPQSDTKRGVVRGEPVRYIQGHHNRTQTRKPRKLGGAKDAKICRRYESGIDLDEIATEFGINKATVYRVLKRNGIPANRRLSDAEATEICIRYLEGESTYALGRAFGVSDVTIGKTLSRHGIVRRPMSETYEAWRRLSNAQESEACRRYQVGETAKSIGNDLGVSETTILKALDRRGIPRNHRTLYESVAKQYAAMRLLSADQEAAVCRQYEAGESGPAIAKALGIGEHAVSNALKRNGIVKRPAVAGERTAPEIEAEVCRLYLAGGTPKAISAETGVGVSTITFVLKRNGIEPRYKVRYTSKQEAEAVRCYLAGETTDEIAAALGISPGGIYPVLRRNGLDPTRKPRLLEWEEARAAQVIRGLPAYRKWRLAVLTRDGRACQRCGTHSTFDNPLHAHHLRSFAEILTEHRPINVDDAERYSALWDTDNGITLCGECHRQAHAGPAPRNSHLVTEDPR